MTDRELLREYATGNDQGAFAELIGRHGDWVYCCARRLVRQGELAEDVAQGVFILLAQKAGRLGRKAHLGGWLFRATQYCAQEAMRAKARRQKHEREAAMQQQIAAGDEATNWDEIWPVLDGAVQKLRASDREAVLLRFYERRSLAAVGQAMGVSEKAAAKRVERAVGKLRGVLAKKGVTAGTVGLGVALAAKVTEAAPVGVVKAATAAAGGGGTGSAGVIAKGAMKMMAWAKVKVAAVIVLGVLGVGIWAGAAGLGTRPASRPVAAGGALPTTMAATDDPASIERLIVILQTREDQLRNFAYSLRESTCVIDAKGSESLKSHSDVELRREDGKSLLHSRHSNDTRPEQPPTDALMLWDGKAMRQIVAPATPQQHPQGLIGGAEPDALRNIAYNHMLGYRVVGDFSIDMKLRKAVANHSTMTQWLTRMVKEKVPMTVEVDQADRTLMVLKVPSRVGDQVAWFDPQRGHMLVRFEYRAPGGAGVERSDVLESRQIAGIWVPIKVVRVSSSTRWPEKTQWIYEVKDFQVGVVKDDELRLEFAEGTDVIDTASTPWNAFRVTHTGTESLDLEEALHRNSR